MATAPSSGIAFGPYRLTRRLGAGGMAEVFLARLDGPAGFQKNLVIKRILPHLVTSPRLTELFLNEARLAALVDHPNLVHVSGFGQIDDQYYLAMEYVDGFTLADFLSRVGSLSPGVACRIAVGVCGALNAIHGARDAEGQPLKLVHRDVSTRNIMLTKAGAVKLLDFGIAVAGEDAEAASMGTLRYMAPEQHTTGSVDHRADLFGLGVVLGELMTGAPLGANSQQRPDDVPESLWPLLQSLLQADPARRPESARAVQADLEVFVAGRGLEGTGVHLAELITQLSPRSAPKRVLSRLTHLTRLTRLTNASELGESRSRRWLLLPLGAGVALTAGLLWPGGPRSDGNVKEAELVTAPLVVDVPAQKPPASPIAPAVTPTTTEVSELTTEAPRKRKRRRAASKPGRLTLNTNPWSKVYLGSKLLGMTPLVGAKLPSGKHRLRLENDELGLSKTIRVTIRPGKTTRLQRSL